jgi:hypothetical protein
VVVGADAAHEEGRREARKRVKLDLTTESAPKHL